METGPTPGGTDAGGDADAQGEPGTSPTRPKIKRSISFSFDTDEPAHDSPEPPTPAVRRRRPPPLLSPTSPIGKSGTVRMLATRACCACAAGGWHWRPRAERRARGPAPASLLTPRVPAIQTRKSAPPWPFGRLWGAPGIRRFRKCLLPMAIRRWQQRMTGAPRVDASVGMQGTCRFGAAALPLTVAPVCLADRLRGPQQYRNPPVRRCRFAAARKLSSLMTQRSCPLRHLVGARSSVHAVAVSQPCQPTHALMLAENSPF
jgi:hypothetical protein